MRDAVSKKVMAFLRTTLLNCPLTSTQIEELVSNERKQNVGEGAVTCRPRQLTEPCSVYR